ncbi:MAG: hypothetical protein LC808_05100 [Actinobacteria bacterium]|nr:hypothetical protein [Actinomycetota bacterium]
MTEPVEQHSCDPGNPCDEPWRHYYPVTDELARRQNVEAVERARQHGPERPPRLPQRQPSVAERTFDRLVGQLESMVLRGGYVPTDEVAKRLYRLSWSNYLSIRPIDREVIASGQERRH